MVLLLPLLGCGSHSPFHEFGETRRNTGFGPLRAANAPSGAHLAQNARRQPKTVSADSYGHVPTSAGMTPGGVQRTSLAPVSAPVPAPALVPAENEEGAPPSLMLAASVTPYGEGAARKTGAAEPNPAPLREANNYARQGRAQPHATDGDYQQIDHETRRGGYAPEMQYEAQPGGYPGEEPGQGGDYVVQPGDTLFDISRRHGISVEELSDINGLSGPDIRAGQRLRVSGQSQSQGGNSGYAAKPPYRETATEPRGYRAPQDERPAVPYSERAEEPNGPYRSAPQAYSYEPRYGAPPARQAEPRYEPAPRFDARRPYEQPYGETKLPARGEGYGAPRSYDDGADYTASNRQYTPDGPFQPTPESPWRGEAEWRRTQPRSEGPAPAYEPRPSAAAPAPAYEPRRPAPQESYEARPPRQTRRAEPPRPQAEAYAAPQQAAPRNAPSQGNGFLHTVQRGETLAVIARRNNIDPRELADYNDLPHNTKLQPGQDVRIPRAEGYGPPRSRPEAADRPAQRGRPAMQAERIEREPKTAAAEPPAPAQPQQQRAPGPRSAQPAPARPPFEKPMAPAPMAVEEPQLAVKSSDAQHMPAARVAVEASEPPVTVAATEQHASLKPEEQPAAERSAPRDCEALLANPEQRQSKMFRMPVQGMVIAKFGSQQDGSFNDGINFSVPKGTPVKAAENGVIAYAGDELPGFGNLVLIRHADGYVTAYAHNDELLVKKCDVVKRGQIISKAGATGKATTPQLHFELRKDSKPIDPEGNVSGS